MKTVTATHARKYYRDDYARVEYGFTQKELKKSFKKVSAAIEREAKAGKLKKFP
jgi:hypothetical protein